MPWRNLSSNEVRLSPAEKAALQAIQGSDSICDEIVANVIGEFRDAISVRAIALGEEGTIPDLVRTHVINRVRWLWLCEYPQLKALQTEHRKSLNDSAEKALADIASGDLKVPPGDGTPADQTPSPSFGTRGGPRDTDPPNRNFTNETQDGI
jgi:hypothetical protein